MKEQITVFSVVYNGYGRFIPQWNEYLNKQTIPVKKLIVLGQNHDEVIITDYPPQWNYSVWNCIYKREIIGDNRFNETMRIAEDYDFNVRVRKGKKANIEQVLYFYNYPREGSLSPIQRQERGR